MGWMFHYCSVSRGNRTLYVYNGGQHEIENLATLCLERTPAYHKWYFETIGKRTFGFLMEDGYVFFTIVDEGIGSMGILKFLQHVRDEFKKVAKKGSRGSFSSLNPVNMQEQLVPVIRRLISSLEHVPCNEDLGPSPSPSDVNGQVEVASCSKAPLLGKHSKSEKKKTRDHVISMRDIELEEHRRSTDRSGKIDSTTMDSNMQTETASPMPLQKDLGSMRTRSSTQNIRKKWWRQVRIVLAIDVAVCLVLFGIWLLVCSGFGCLR